MLYYLLILYFNYLKYLFLSEFLIENNSLQQINMKNDNKVKMPLQEDKNISNLNVDFESFQDLLNKMILKLLFIIVHSILIV